MNKLILIFFKVLSMFIKKDKNLITILCRGYSGSNATPIIERFSSDKFKNLKVNILIEDNRKLKMHIGSERIAILKNKIKKYIYVFKSQLVISTHGFYRLREDNIMLNLWHGIPLKAMSLMNKGGTDNVGFIQDNYFLSTSELYNTVMNSCLGLRVDRYFVAGYPRNDYLFNQDGLSNLEELIGVETDKKVILYVPTYRDSVKDYQTRNENIFGLSAFNFKDFNVYLKKNNLLFILKLHPNEEELFVQKYSNLSDNIVFLKEKDLEKHKMDLYKILNAVDLLITDYSSIYFDYLLLDRPIIFVPYDLDDYRKTRGILLEPYDFWTPGPKCFDQISIQNEILNSLNNINYFKEDREVIRNLMHKYQDGNSTDRVMQLICKIINR